MGTKPNPYDGLSWIRTDELRTPTSTAPADNLGRFEYFKGTFKEAVKQSQDNVTDAPFSNVTLGGLKAWQNSDTFGTDSRLKLIDDDGSTTSGYVSMKLANNWQGLFYVKTENQDFFEDNVKANWVTDDWQVNNADFQKELNQAVNLLEDEGWPSVWVQDNAESSSSRIVFGLDSDDYFSFDIDEESNDAGQARVRLGGSQYLSNTRVDDEIWITCVYLRKWNADYIWPVNEDDEEEEDEEEDDPNDDCPPGQTMNEFGICVLIPKPEPDKKCDEGYTWDEGSQTCLKDDDNIDDVTTFGMIMVLGAIGAVVYYALKVRS